MNLLIIAQLIISAHMKQLHVNTFAFSRHFYHELTKIINKNKTLE